MLHILFVILKILGIILAVILGILLLLVCIVLFVPLRYQGEAKSGGRLEDIRVHGQVSWLFGLVKAVVDIRNKAPDFYIQIAWKKFGDRPESKQETEEQAEYGKHKRKKNHGKDKETAEGGKQKESEKTNQEREEERAENKRDEKLQKPETASQSDSEDYEGYKEDQAVCKEKSGISEEGREAASETLKTWTQDREESWEKDEKKPSFLEKIKGKLEKIAAKLRRLPEKFKCTIQKFCDKMEEISGKRDKLIALITEPVHVNAFGKGKRELIWLLGHLSPQVLEADIHYGFADPALTGMVLAGFGVLYPFFEDHIQITPDFTEKVLEGNIRVKGRIYAAHLAVFAVRILLSRDVRRTIKNVRNFKL